MAKGKADNTEKGTSRMGMVRAVLQELGMDAKPQELQARIKEKFGVELPKQVISNYKFQIKSKSGAGTGGRTQHEASAGGLRVEDFEAVRGLVSRLGADQVKRLVDVVG